MAEWRVELISKESDRTFVYGVAYLGEQTDEQVFKAALACHGRMIVEGRVDEVVHADRGSVQRIR